MNIYLCNPPWRKAGKLGIRAGSRWPHFQPEHPHRPSIPGYLPFPFFLAYSAALLRKAGFGELNLIDAIALGWDEETFLKHIEEIKPDLIIMEVSTPSIENDLILAHQIKNRTNSKIILVGPHYPMYEKNFLVENTQVDLTAIGEYERTILNICLNLKEKKGLKNIPGIVYREAKEIFVNPRSKALIDLDTLPFPAWDLLPMQHYNDAVCHLPEPNAQILASRGCPYHCSFCLFPQVMYGGSNYRTRVVNSVVEEMEQLIGKYDLKAIVFDDDTFNIGKPRLLRFCQEIRERHLEIPWTIMARADLMDAEILQNMAQSGLYAVKYGYESAAQNLVDEAKKDLDLSQVDHIIRLTKSLGVKVHLTFTFGLPGETTETIEKTISKCLELAPDNVQFSIVAPFPGSQLYQKLSLAGQLKAGSYSEYVGSEKAVIETPLLSASELEAGCQKAKETWQEFLIEERFAKSFLRNLKNLSKHPPLFKVFEGRKKLLLIRSSSLSLVKKALQIIRNYNADLSLWSLAQEKVLSDLKSTQLLNGLLPYPNSYFTDQNLDKNLCKKILHQNFQTGIIFYHNESRTGHENVEAFAAKLAIPKWIGIDEQGNIFEVLL